MWYIMNEFNKKIGLERLIPDLITKNEVTGLETLKLHLERYRFAAKFARGRVLDIACGVGYGTYEMNKFVSDKVTQFVGVDISDDCIQYAKKRYKDKKITYITEDAMKFSDSQKFDTIVSLETIEHLPNPKLFIDHLIALLAPNGRIIGSAPITPTVDINPYHLTDFTGYSFRELFLSNNMIEIDKLIQVQPFNVFNILSKKEERLIDLRKNLLSYYFKKPSNLLKRLASVIKYGFTTHYLTIAWKIK